MDLSVIQGTITGLKTAFDIAKGISELKTMTEVQSKVIELQRAILEAQASAMTANAQQYAAAEELRRLGEELDRAKGWQQERARYKLFQGDGVRGGVVYALREDSRKEGEPAHYLCPNCYEQGRKAILSNGSNPAGFTHWLCPVCKAQTPTGYRGSVGADFAPA